MKTSKTPNYPMPLYSSFSAGDMTFLYFKQEGKIGFTVIPRGWEGKIPKHQQNVNDTLAARAFHQALNIDLPAVDLEPLAQVRVQQDFLPAVVTGSSLKGSGTMEQMKFVRQTQVDNEVRTVLRDARGYELTHVLTMYPGSRYFEVHTEFVNRSKEPVTLELLESFALGFLSPFVKDEGLDCYRIHRYRSFWAAEGREECLSAEALGLETSWSRFAPRSLRFGQRSTSAVREFFPSAVIEDSQNGVCWGVQLGTLGPWQLECYRMTDFLVLSGGCPDREFGGWERQVLPGKKVVSMPAVLTCVAGDAALAMSRLTDRPVEQREYPAPAEEGYPLMFNEFCTTWANPYPEKVLPELARAKELGVKYFTLDDGWFTVHGEWNTIKPGKYPDGFGALVEQIRQAGFVPGLWFEPEHVRKSAWVFQHHPEWMLKFKGVMQGESDLYFLDLRQKPVWKFLDRTMAKTIREYGIGYIKIDYNRSFVGADTPNGSAPEGAQEYVQAVHDYFAHLKHLFPELVIEICASGGHRLTSQWMKFGDQASFSDAHESLAIPLIAANTLWQIPASSNQVWATLREDDDCDRLSYTLCAGFLGRLCYSGYVSKVSDKNFALVKESSRMYDLARPYLASGCDTQIHRELTSDSYDTPKGWQAVIRSRTGRPEKMLVVHFFGDAPKQEELQMPEGVKIVEVFSPAGVSAELKKGKLIFSHIRNYTGLVLWIATK